MMLKAVSKKIITLLVGFLLVVTMFPQTFATDTESETYSLKVNVSADVYQITDENGEYTDSVKSSVKTGSGDVCRAIQNIQKLNGEEQLDANTELYDEIISHIDKGKSITNLNELNEGTYLIYAKGYVPSFVVLKTDMKVDLEEEPIVEKEEINKENDGEEETQAVTEETKDESSVKDDSETKDKVVNRKSATVTRQTRAIGDTFNVTYHAGAGTFSGGGTENILTYQQNTSAEPVISKTPNIGNDGTATSTYANNYENTDVVTINGASSLNIEVWYSTESKSYDWLAIYPEDVTPTSSNYSQATISDGKLGGHGSYTGYTKPSDDDATYHKTFTVDGDTAQFYFRSDSSDAYYGYYAIVTADNVVSLINGEYEQPTPNNPDYVFKGWWDNPSFTGSRVKDLKFTEETELYAKYGEEDFNISLIYYDSRVNNGRTALNSSNSCDCTMDTLSGFLTLQTNIISNSINQDYGVGELEIKLYGLEKFGLTNTSISGDLFTYEHHTGTYNPSTRQIENDYYIIRNKQAITQGSNIDAMLQIVYRMGNSNAGCPFNDSSGEVYAEYGYSQSNSLSFEFHIGKQGYRISGNDSQFNINYSDGLPSDWDDYYWMRTGYQTTQTTSPTKSMKTSHNPHYVLTGLPPGCYVYWLDYNGNRLLEVPYNSESGAYEITTNSAGYVMVGVPKSDYDVGDVLNMTLKDYNNYYFKYNNIAYVEENETLLDEKNLSLIVRDTIQTIPPGSAVSLQMRWTTDFYVSNILSSNAKRACAGYYYSTSYDGEYRVKLGFDGVYFKSAEDEYLLLDDSYYYIKSVDMPKLKNMNDLSPDENYSLYVRYRDSDEYVLYGENYNRDQTVYFPNNAKVVAAYAVSSTVSGRFGNSGSSGESLECDCIFEKTHEYYEKDGHIGCVGYIDMLDPNTLDSILVKDTPDYNSVLTDFGYPTSDMNNYGEYMVRANNESTIKADSYVGYVGIKDTLNEDKTGYSDFMLTVYLSHLKSRSCRSLNGYDVYVVLPEHVKLQAGADEIKALLLSSEFKDAMTQESSSGNSVMKHMMNTGQFDSFEEFMQFYYDSLTISTTERNGSTVIELHYDFPEPLLLSDTCSDFSALWLPVRVYDTDVLDYGNSISIAAYAQPRLDTTTSTFENYNANAGFLHDNYSNILINPTNRNSSSDMSGYAWPDTNDIDGDGDTTERFNEFHSTVVYSKAMEALQEFTKLVDTENSSWKVGASYVNSDSDYSYRLRTRTASTGMTNLIMYDRIETYTPVGESSWQGTYTGIDLTRSTAQGYVPTVYYSTNSTVGKLSEDTSWQLYDSSVDLSIVKALAFDYGNQIIQPNTIASVDISMHAPPGDSDLYTYNKYGAEWNRVDPATNYVFEETEEFESNVTVISLNDEIADTKSLSVKKQWFGDGDYTGGRPNTVYFDVYQDDILYGTYSVTSANGWQNTVSGLPSFANDGHEYNYTIQEHAVNGYRSEVDGTTIKNTYDMSLPLPTGIIVLKNLLLELMAIIILMAGVRWSKKRYDELQ